MKMGKCAVENRRCRLVWALGTLLLSACPGPAFVVNGLAVNEAQWNADRTKISTQASAALDCPQENLRLTLLDAKETYLGGDSTIMAATQIEASGCGRRAIYSKTPSGWSAN